MLRNPRLRFPGQTLAAELDSGSLFLRIFSMGVADSFKNTETQNSKAISPLWFCTPTLIKPPYLSPRDQRFLCLTVVAPPYSPQP